MYRKSSLLANTVRNFVDESKIFKALSCSICMEVFINPCNVGCGHSFCSDCMADWIKSNLDNRKMPHCPLCQSKINPEEIRKDLLAYNLC